MFFKQNISVISAKNERLAQELSQMFLVIVEENIEVYSAETGDYVFAYEGLALDDMVNPKEDALMNFSENIPKTFSDDDIVIVFGLGTGYLFDYVAQNTKAQIILWEPKIDILRYCIEFIDLTASLALENVRLVANEAELLQTLNRIFVKEKSAVKVIYPDAYMQLLPENLNKLQSDVTELVIGA